MTEEKVKNRGWVKNAAIIFLSVMLVLTFFSNTIMNRSLPEVSVQYVQSGTISTKVRGTGSIEAVTTYQVKASDARKVLSVAVKTDQQVEPGDVLFELATGDSADLEAAQETLRSAQYAYQQALISLGDADNSGDYLQLRRLKDALEQAIADRDALTAVTAGDISAAQSDQDVAQTVYAQATAALETAKEKLEAAGGATTGGSGDFSGVQAAQTALNSAKTALEAAKVQHQDAYDVLTAEAVYQHTQNTAYSKEAYMKALAQEHEKDTEVYHPSDTNSSYSGTYTWEQLAEAYTAISEASDAVTRAQNAYDAAYSSYYSNLEPDNSVLVTKVNKAQATLDAAETALTAAKDRVTNLTSQKQAYDTAEAAVETAQNAVEDQVIQQKLSNLDLQQKRDAISDAQKQISELSGSTNGGGQILSDVSGVVKSIGVTAGDTTSADAVLATIEVPDRGYQVSFSVTTEQAKKVTVGDSAEISTGWWGDSGLSARLATIKPDPTNPATNKLLVFEVTGDDVTSGTQVSVSIGQKSQNYDAVVPNSAVREDSNGSFVLTVVAKNSPLGNRYIATRVDIQVLAKDDTNTAVSGGLTSWDYVISNSTKPIEKGMQVRIADEG